MSISTLEGGGRYDGPRLQDGVEHIVEEGPLLVSQSSACIRSCTWHGIAPNRQEKNEVRTFTHFVYGQFAETFAEDLGD